MDDHESKKTSPNLHPIPRSEDIHPRGECTDLPSSLAALEWLLVKLYCLEIVSHLLQRRG